MADDRAGAGQGPAGASATAGRAARPGGRLRGVLDVGSGAVAALGFPFVVAAAGPTPMLEGVPRELLVVLAPFRLAQLIASPEPTVVACRRAWAVGLGFFAVLLHWLWVTMTRYGGLPGPQSLLFLALLVAFCAAFFAALPWAARRLMGRGWPLPWALAAAVVVCEWLRGDGAGFPWGAWGYAAARHMPVAHLAQLGGVPLIGAWLAALGGLLAELVGPGRAGALAGHPGPLPRPARAGAGAPRSGRRQQLAVGAALAAMWGVGLALWHRPQICTPGPRVALVQGNIDQSVKNRPGGHEADIFDVHRRLSLAAAEAGAELIIWPESTVPGVVDTRRPWPEAWRLPVPTIFGAVARDSRGRYFNSAVWAEPDGSLRGRYDKHHLVPFGEYVPLRGVLPVDRLVPGLIDLTPGEADVTLGPQGRWGPLICYDGVFAQFARRQAAAGATVLTNLTNDAWYGVTGAPYQHRDFYVMRAIETGRWVARATNTGVSLFIDPRGGQHRATRLGERGFALGRVEHCAGTTPYRQVGEWVVVAAVLSLLGSLLPRRRPARP